MLPRVSLSLACIALSCGRTPSKSAPSADAAAVTAPSSASAARDETCRDARFPRHVHVEPGDLVPDEASLRVGAIEADVAADAGVRCYAPGPHVAFNSLEWCCR